MEDLTQEHLADVASKGQTIIPTILVLPMLVR
jgi:hypothetical protein